jgi:hypothetical protein
MTWKPPLYRIVAGVVDVRAFDDERLAFVRKNIQRLRTEPREIDDLEYELRAMTELHRTFTADLLLLGTNNELWVARCVNAVFTCQPRKHQRDLADRLAARDGIHYRLPADGYSLERLADVEAIARRHDPRDVPRLVDTLRYCNLPTPSEQELRRAIYDTLSTFDRPEARDTLLAALATEPDDIAALVIDRIYRHPSLLDGLPARIDAAWRPPRDERLAKRLLAALVRSDDEGKHLAWARANYPALVREVGDGVY